MGDLTNKQISNTYDGLIKTNDEQPIDGTLKTLQDGVGNNLPMQVSTTGVNFTGTVTGIPAGTDTTYDFGAAGAAGNINFALTGSDATNDVVTMQAGTNITIKDNGSNNFTIDAAGGGGGGGDVAYGCYGGSGMKGVLYRNTSTTSSLRTWITTTGYGTTAVNAGEQGHYAIAGIQPGDTIREMHVGISTSQLGATMEVAIYDVDVDSDNNLYINDRLLSLGTVDASTTGSKIISLGTPFTMPSGKVNSQIAIVLFPSTAGVGVTHFSQATWNGAGGDPAGLIVYRAMALYVTPGVNPGDPLPSNIGINGVGGAAYGSNTSGGLWVLWR